MAINLAAALSRLGPAAKRMGPIVEQLAPELESLMSGGAGGAGPAGQTGKGLSGIGPQLQEALQGLRGQGESAQGGLGASLASVFGSSGDQPTGAAQAAPPRNPPVSALPGPGEQEGGSALDTAQFWGDVVGVADPTGIVDAANAGVSMWRASQAQSSAERSEHMRNALISGISVVPYVGDIAKAAKYGSKGAKAAKGASRAARATEEVVEAAPVMEQFSPAGKVDIASILEPKPGKFSGAGAVGGGGGGRFRPPPPPGGDDDDEPRQSPLGAGGGAGGIDPSLLSEALQGGLAGGAAGGLAASIMPSRSNIEPAAYGATQGLGGAPGQMISQDLKRIGGRRAETMKTLVNPFSNPITKVTTMFSEMFETGKEMPFMFERWGESLKESRRHLMEFSGTIASAMLESERREILRGMESGRRTGGSTKMLTEALDDLKDDLQPWRDLMTNGFNTLATFGIRAVDLLEDIVSMIPAVQVLFWIQENWPWGDKDKETHAFEMMEFFRDIGPSGERESGRPKKPGGGP